MVNAGGRLIPAAALIIQAFCSLSLPNRRWTIAALTVVSGITLANLIVIYVVWLPYRADYAAIISSFGKIDRGSRVLVGGSGEGEDPPFNDLTQYPMFYAPILAVHYADAFVPNLFTAVGKQPVQPRAEIRRLAIPYGGPMPMRVLAAVAAGQPGRQPQLQRIPRPGPWHKSKAGPVAAAAKRSWSEPWFRRSSRPA